MTEFVDKRIRLKRCSMCERDLPLGMFSRNKDSNDRYRTNCKDCARTSRDAWHERNPRPGLTARRRQAVREFVIKAKQSPCVDCGRRFHHSLMEFDHVGEHEKIEAISWLAVKTLSIEKVEAEIAKCDLVCALCHRVRSWNRQHPDDPITAQPG